MSEFPTKPESPATGPSAPQFDVASQPSYARTLFFGPDGLRPGWGLAFYALAFFLLQRFVVELAWMRDLGSSSLWSMMLEELGDFAAAAIPAIVLARIERRPWKSYGLPGAQIFGRLFWSGVLWGFVAISVLICGLYGFHVFSFGHIVLHSGQRGPCWLGCLKSSSCADIRNSRWRAASASGERPSPYRAHSGCSICVTAASSGRDCWRPRASDFSSA